MLFMYRYVDILNDAIFDVLFSPITVGVTPYEGSINVCACSPWPNHRRTGRDRSVVGWPSALHGPTATLDTPDHRSQARIERKQDPIPSRRTNGQALGMTKDKRKTSPAHHVILHLSSMHLPSNACFLKKSARHFRVQKKQS